MSKKRLVAYFYLLLTSIIWGVAGPVIKYTLQYFPPSIFLVYRFAISAVLGLIILRHEQLALPKKASVVFMLILAAFLTSTVRLGLLFFGFDQTSSLSGSLISAMGPVLLVLSGHYLFSEKVTRVEEIGMGLAFIGTLISVTSPVLAADSTVFNATTKGNVIVFISLIADVAAILAAKYVLKRNASGNLLANLSFIIGFVTLLPLALYQFDMHTIFNTIISAPINGHLGVLYMAFLSGTLAYTLHNKALKQVEVGEASLFAYLTPIWAAPLSLLWLGEKITGPFLVGAVIIFVGVAIAEYKRRVG